MSEIETLRRDLNDAQADLQAAKAEMQEWQMGVVDMVSDLAVEFTTIVIQVADELQRVSNILSKKSLTVEEDEVVAQIDHFVPKIKEALDAGRVRERLLESIVGQGKKWTK